MFKLREKLIRLLGGQPRTNESASLPSAPRPPGFSETTMKVKKIGASGTTFNTRDEKRLKEELARLISKEMLENNAIEFARGHEQGFTTIYAKAYVCIPEGEKAI